VILGDPSPRPVAELLDRNGQLRFVDGDDFGQPLGGRLQGPVVLGAQVDVGAGSAGKHIDRRTGGEHVHVQRELR
jgi:hypothetical protein